MTQLLSEECRRLEFYLKQYKIAGSWSGLRDSGTLRSSWSLSEAGSEPAAETETLTIVHPCNRMPSSYIFKFILLA